MYTVRKFFVSQFRKPTGFWGRFSTILMRIFNHKQHKAVRKQFLDHKNAEKVFEIGFGDGSLIRKLSRNNRTHFYGIDISVDMVSLADKKNAKLRKQARLHLSIADIDNIPYENDKFDIVYTINTVYFWRDIDRAFAEINRVLKPKGVFIHVFYTKKRLEKMAGNKVEGFAKYNIDEIKNAALSNGFEILETKILKSDVSVCMIVKKEDRHFS